jgi:CBS domain containing-hemolysin-like protein
MVILFPIGYPISKTLDYIVGHEEKHFCKTILVAFLKSQKHALSNEEIKMSTGAINLMRRKVVTLMIRKIFHLKESDVLSDMLVQKIKKKGYSRIPIYNDKNECVKILITKSMIFYGDYKNRRILECPFKFVDPVPVSDQNNAYQALSRMKKYQTTILMVVEKNSDNIKDYSGMGVGFISCVKL